MPDDRLDVSRRDFMYAGSTSFLALTNPGQISLDPPSDADQAYEFQGVADLIGPADARPDPGSSFFDEKTFYAYRYETTDGDRYFITQDDDEWTHLEMNPTNQVDELKTTQYDSQFNLTFARPNEPTAIRWNATNVTNDQPEVVLTGTASLQSKERGNYAPGSEAIPGVAFRLTDTPGAGETATAGYYTTDDGFGFGRDDQDSYVFIRQDGSQTTVYRDDWNGEEPPGFDNFESHIRICRFEHLYYGGGAIEMQLVGYTDDHDGRLYTVHRFTSENLGTSRPPFSQPNLPVAFDTSGLTPELRATAAHYEKAEREGDARFLGEHGSRSGIDTSDWYHVISWRKKTGYEMVNIKPLFVNAFASSTNMKMEIQQNTTLGDGAGGSPTWQDATHADPDESPLEWITGDAAVITEDGDRRWAGHAPAGQGASPGGPSLATLIENLDAGDTVTLAAQAYSNSGELFVVPAQEAFY